MTGGTFVLDTNEHFDSKLGHIPSWSATSSSGRVLIYVGPSIFRLGINGHVPRQKVIRGAKKTRLMVIGESQVMTVKRGRPETNQRPTRKNRQKTRRRSQSQHSWEVFRRAWLSD